MQPDRCVLLCLDLDTAERIGARSLTGPIALVLRVARVAHRTLSRIVSASTPAGHALVEAVLVPHRVSP